MKTYIVEVPAKDVDLVVDEEIYIQYAGSKFVNKYKFKSGDIVSVQDNIGLIDSYHIDKCSVLREVVLVSQVKQLIDGVDMEELKVVSQFKANGFH